MSRPKPREWKGLLQQFLFTFKFTHVLYAFPTNIVFLHINIIWFHTYRSIFHVKLDCLKGVFKKLSMFFLLLFLNWKKDGGSFDNSMEVRNRFWRKIKAMSFTWFGTLEAWNPINPQDSLLLVQLIVQPDPVLNQIPRWIQETFSPQIQMESNARWWNCSGGGAGRKAKCNIHVLVI